MNRARVDGGVGVVEPPRRTIDPPQKDVQSPHIDKCLPPNPPPPPVVLVTPLATRKNRFAPAHRAPKNLYKDTVLYYTVYIHITSEMQVIMSSSSEEECDGAWSRGVVEPYQCEPLAKPRAPKPPPAKKPKIIVDRSVGRPPDATRLFAPDSPTTEEDEEEDEERVEVIGDGGGSSVHEQPPWSVYVICID